MTVDQDWRRTAVVYQVYTRSFADSDGDGVGDLPGLRSRLDHLVRLGVDALRLNPFQPSAEFDALATAAAHRGLRIFGTAGLRIPSPRRARPADQAPGLDFPLLKLPWDAETFRSAVRRGLDTQARTGTGPAWALSSHDVPRPASRLALPSGADPDAWLASSGTSPVIDEGLGRRRARAAALMMLALPGAAFLYQGEELGLPEVADLPPSALRDPVFRRTGGRLRGRDGCRVPLPWKRSGPSLGFGSGAPWLPQPERFAELSVEEQETSPASTLALYRYALLLRRTRPELGGTGLRFVDGPPGVLSFRRGGGFMCLVNLSARAVPLPPGKILLASLPGVAAPLPPDEAVWLTLDSDADPS